MAEIYQLCFPNGKSYIGITSKSSYSRFCEHVSLASRNAGYAVHKAIKKYGSSSITIRVLAVCEFDYATRLEPSAIRVFNTKYPNGYNLTSGGEGVVGNVLTDNTKLLLSKLNFGKKLSKGTKEKISSAVKKTMSNPDVRDKISKKLSGKVVSEETRKKLSIAAKLRYENNEERIKASKLRLGKKASDETRKKLSDSLNAYYAKKGKSNA